MLPFLLKEFDRKHTVNQQIQFLLEFPVFLLLFHSQAAIILRSIFVA